MLYANHKITCGIKGKQEPLVLNKDDPVTDEVLKQLGYVGDAEIQRAIDNGTLYWEEGQAANVEAQLEQAGNGKPPE